MNAKNFCECRACGYKGEIGKYETKCPGCLDTRYLITIKKGEDYGEPKETRIVF